MPVWSQLIRLWPLWLAILCALSGWQARGTADSAREAKTRAAQAEVIAKRQIDAAAKISGLRSKYDDLMARANALPSGNCGLSHSRARILREIH